VRSYFLEDNDDVTDECLYRVYKLDIICSSQWQRKANQSPQAFVHCARAGYAFLFLFIKRLPAKKVPPVTKRMELIGSGATEISRTVQA